MNNPHVEALYYRVWHDNSVDYSKAEPLVHEKPGFSLHIEAERLRVRMKEHYATEAAARRAVEPFLRLWELDAALRHRLGELEFEFEHAEVKDRMLEHSLGDERGIVNVCSHDMLFVSTQEHAVVSKGKYPDPPCQLACSADVDLMFNCYRMYREQHARLGDAAYFCLTVLERWSGKGSSQRKAAAKRYGISYPLLCKLADLADAKGGREARKAKGAEAEFTPAERQWLDQAMKALIRRAAEVAYDPAASRPKITMADLPDL